MANHISISGTNVSQLSDLRLLSNGSCDIYLIPEGSITANQSIYINKFNNVTFIAFDNIFTDYPNRILITFEENCTNMMLQYTFGSNTDIFTSPNAYIFAYTINCTTWADNVYKLVITLNSTAPDFIQIDFGTSLPDLSLSSLVNYSIYNKNSNNNSNNSNSTGKYGITIC